VGSFSFLRALFLFLPQEKEKSGFDISSYSLTAAFVLNAWGNKKIYKMRMHKGMGKEDCLVFGGPFSSVDTNENAIFKIQKQDSSLKFQFLGMSTLASSGICPGGNRDFFFIYLNWNKSNLLSS
jgi:hypothetical protein